MAITNVITGTLSIALALLRTMSGDETGTGRSSVSAEHSFAATASLPDTIQASGYVKGTVVAAAGDWLLAHATDPFGSMGDATYSPGLTVDGKKIKLLVVKNNDASNSVTIRQGATAGCPIFTAASDGFTIQPGATMILMFPEGTAALTTTSNDKVTIEVEGGTPSLDVLVVYGT